MQFDKNWACLKLLIFDATVCGLCRIEVTQWRKFIFEEVKFALSGSSSPFVKFAHFHYGFWKNPPLDPMQDEMFLSQFHILNSLKSLFNIILPVVLKSSEWFNLKIIGICNLFHAFYLLNLAFLSITSIILGRMYVYQNFWNGYSPGCHLRDRVRSLVIPYRICCGQIGTKIDFYFTKHFDTSLSESFHITIFHSCTTDAK